MATLKELKERSSLYEWGQPESDLQPVGNAPGKYWNPSTQTFITVGGDNRTQASTTPGKASGGGYYPITGGTKTTTTRTPTMAMPETPTIPAFTAPKWDEKEIGRLAQKKAAPKLRALRRQMERESGRQYENPNVKRMTLRQAMEGYGLGLGSAMAEAESAGRAEYGQKYAAEFAGAQTTYSAQTQALMQSYQNAFNAYLTSMQQTTTTGTGGGSTQSGMVHGGYSAGGKEQFKWADILDPRRFQVGGA